MPPTVIAKMRKHQRAEDGLRSSFTSIALQQLPQIESQDRICQSSFKLMEHGNWPRRFVQIRDGSGPFLVQAGSRDLFWRDMSDK